MRRLSLISVLAACALSVGGCDRETPAKGASGTRARRIAPATPKADAGFGKRQRPARRAELSFCRTASARCSVQRRRWPRSRADRFCRTAFIGQYLGDILRAVQNRDADFGCACGAGGRKDHRDRRGAGSAGRAKSCCRFFSKAASRISNPISIPNNRVVAGCSAASPALPTTILYDSEGREVWRVIGGVEWDDAEISALIGRG